MKKSILICLLFSLNLFSQENNPLDLVKKRFEILEKSYQSQGKNPLYIQDLIARRFINLPDWLKKRHEDVRYIYNPAPLTWDRWQKTALGLVQQIIDEKKDLSIPILMDWHKSALSGKLADGINVGNFKVSKNYGMNTKKAWALSADEIANLEKFRWTVDPDLRINWTYLTCQEDLKPEMTLLSQESCKDILQESNKLTNLFNPFWKKTKQELKNNILMNESGKENWFWFACWPKIENPEEAFFTSSQGIQKACGMIEYPNPQAVQRTLQSIIESINHFFQQPNGNDPLAFAILKQREFVALHPFADGNGRMSRWIMDIILLRSGLFPIYLPDMNIDLSLSLESYYQYALQSMNESLEIMEHCLVPEFVNSKECQIVPLP